MAILGPDGRPIGGGNGSVSKEVREIVERAQGIAKEGDPVSALQQMVYAYQQDVASDMVLNTTCDLLESIVRASEAAQDPVADGQPASNLILPGNIKVADTAPLIPESLEELSPEEQTQLMSGPRGEYFLFDQLRRNREHPIANYQVGRRFFDMGQPFLARPFLAQARKLAEEGFGENDLPEEQRAEFGMAVDVSLAEALMALGDYQEAVNGFHAINDRFGSLLIWLVLEMAECYALLRQPDEAEEVYNIATEDAVRQVPGLEEARDEVGDLIARVRDFTDVEEMDLRDWHYVQTRGMLLAVNQDESTPGERFVFCQPSESDVAGIVSMAGSVLAERDMKPQRIFWLGVNSEPLAQLFREVLHVHPENVRAYEPGDNTEDEDNLALLVMAHSFDVFTLPDEAAMIDLLNARAGLITFALDVRWTERQPMTPDIAGFLSQACNLPWEPRLQVSDDQQTVTQLEEKRDAVAVAADIAALFPPLKESNEVAHELLEGYDTCTDLILDHRDGTLNRKSVVTHSPVKSPRFGF